MTSRGSADLAINGWNAEYVDAMYERWVEEPSSVDSSWRLLFQGFDLGVRRADEQSAAGTPPGSPPAVAESGVAHTKQGRVDSLIYHYRDIGHFAARLDPLGRPRPEPEHLRLESFGLTESDLDERFDPGVLPLASPASLRQIIDVLEETYCRHVGIEYMHIQDRARRRWLQARMEPVRNAPPFTRDQKMRVLRELVEAHGFEQFLHTRYRGKKRFGLDGGESLIPMLDEFAEFGPEFGVHEYTIGMAHRGRLNVLVNILHKTYDQIFTEFEEAWREDFLEGGGDVKYHRGYSGDFTTLEGHNIRMTLSPNPSHLEFVNSVVLGRARAKQRIRKDVNRLECVPILIHGDASFPGQGIVAECLNMMRLDGYTVGGAIHLIVNNQVGFTTNPRDSHSGRYCTDIAKMIDAPILHVNGDDPEACVFAARLAIAYRQEFKNDVVIDMWCIRQHGHNEGDEPRFTQPLMYDLIEKHVPVVETYARRLMDEGMLSEAEYTTLREDVKRQMDEAQTRTKDKPVEPTVRAFGSVWGELTERYSDDPVETGVPRERLLEVSRALGRVPEDFHAHRKLGKLLGYRGSVVENDEPLDWAMGEMLAYGTLLLEDYPVRLTGQDVERGTFSHRHAVLFDQKTGLSYEPINNIADGQAKFCVHNSPLTESACLGFEYGYSLGHPNMLVIWEAQFGDFVNGAQVIIDQFIASAEAKWSRFSGLTMFLPHGYEGQGPEHSSARLERFLTLCADDNMQVVYPTTPAQMFHVVRRQMKRSFRKPLVIMTPKSMLRNPRAVSPIEDLVSNRFHHVLDDEAVRDPKSVRRLVFCSGKVFYDLDAQRKKVGADHVAIVRLEQLYPFRRASIQPVLDKYASATEHMWVQEEPENMGAWRFVDDMFQTAFELDLHYLGRDPHASPAVASQKMHVQEQDRIMVSAIGLPTDDGADAPSKPTPSAPKSTSRAGAA